MILVDRARHRQSHWHRHCPAGQECLRNAARETRRRAGHRHDRPGLGAGHEEGLGHRHQPGRAHLPCRHHCARAGHSGGGGLWRCNRETGRGRARSPFPARRAIPAMSIRGILDVEVLHMQMDKLPALPVKISMNVGNPELAFDFQRLPNAGIGLARLEFIIARMIGVHPKAALAYPNARSRISRKLIDAHCAGYPDPVSFYVDKLTRRHCHARRRVLPEAGDRASVGFQIQRILQPHRRQAVRTGGGKSDARFPRRFALYRRVFPRLFRAGVPGAEARCATKWG